MTQPLDLAATQLLNGLTVEASAGTGKTYSVAALVTRELALDDDLRIENILVTTFTRSAAAELKDRIRRRLVDTAEALATGKSDSVDALLTILANADLDTRRRYVRNLRRAVDGFDGATIGTIHSVCSRVLTIAGVDANGQDGEEFSARTVAEVVNDRLVSEALTSDTAWDTDRVTKMVQIRLDNPLSVPFFEVEDPELREQLSRFVEVLDDIVHQVQQKTLRHPSFNDLIRRAEEVLSGDQGESVRRRFAERFALAIVDEAQDTDGLQWRLFHHIFPKGVRDATNRLISVGDPKQAIYSFRGADVYAYLGARDAELVSTLSVNFRSDQPLIDALNVLFEGKSLGEGIEYRPVVAEPKHQDSRIRGMSPVEVVDFGKIGNIVEVAMAACRQVARILKHGEILYRGDFVPVGPEHVCVLANSNTVVKLVRDGLQRMGIPAVASGADSVFADFTAKDIRVLLRALDKISDAGRVRNLATTAFFGVSLGDPRLLPDDLRENDKADDLVLDIQERLSVWLQRLRRGGVSALLAALEGENDVMASFVSGANGERRLADLNHVFELLHRETRGRSATPSELIEVFDRLASLQKDSELVTRHVESDADAVQIMTTHKAKGLEFPCVVVADLWKPKPYEPHRGPPRFRERDDDGVYVDYVDVGWVIDRLAQSSKKSHEAAQAEEQRRLLYVALTRAESHVSFMWPSANPDKSIINEALNTSMIGSPSADDRVLVGRLALDDLPKLDDYRYEAAAERSNQVVAVGPAAVEQSLRRTSFTGITRAQKSMTRIVGAPEYDLPGSGNDEDTNPFAPRSRYASPETPTGVTMPLARLAGGKHVGKVLHRVYELIDTSASDLRAEVANTCSVVITGGQLAVERESVIDGVHASLVTPLGIAFADKTLADIGSASRLPELDFEMSVASLAAGVKVSDFGRILTGLLDASDILHPYASQLTHQSFDIDLAGIVNGSIDAVLQTGTNERPELWITDYKSNRLDQDGDLQVIDGYRQDRLLEAMVHHHYPLQALIYGAAMYRYLRWRMPDRDDHANFIKGFSYFFIRGMVGPSTPSEDGCPNGVFTWIAPAGLWRRLSDRLGGDAL